MTRSGSLACAARLAAILREVAPPLGAFHGGTLAAIADALDGGDIERLSSVLTHAPLPSRTGPAATVARVAVTKLLAFADAAPEPCATLARYVAFALPRRATFTPDVPAWWIGSGAAHRLLRRACGVPNPPPSWEPEHAAYFRAAGALVRSRRELGSLLLEATSAYAIQPEWIAAAAWYGGRNVGLFARATFDDLLAAAEKWLGAAVPPSDARAAAVKALNVLGVGKKEANAIVASVPSSDEFRVDVTKSDAPEIERHVEATERSSPSALAGQLEDEIRGELAERWKRVPAWLRPLRESLLDGTIRSKTRTRRGHVVRIERRDRSVFRIPEPVDRSALARLDGLGFPASHALVEFAAAFDGLSGPNGTFVRASKLARVKTSSSRASALALFDAADLRGWRDAVPVFEDMGGDMLLVRPRGSLAWATHDPVEIAPAYKTLREFVARFFGLART